MIPRPQFEPITEATQARIQASFAKQIVMQTIGATLEYIEAGQVKIRLPFGDSLIQQHGFIHAGIITTIVDSACGYAASTLMPESSEVLTVEFKTNLLSPAKGDYFVATGQVIKAGRTITVCEGYVMANGDETQRMIATMQTTMFCVQN